MTEKESGIILEGGNNICEFAKWRKDNSNLLFYNDLVFIYEFQSDANIPFEIYHLLAKSISEEKIEECFLPKVKSELKGIYFQPLSRVGLYPFVCNCNKVHMIVVLPKIGKVPDAEDAFVEDALKCVDRLSDMSFYALNYGYVGGWLDYFDKSKVEFSGSTPGKLDMRLFLSISYIYSISELLKKDFRRYYIERCGIRKDNLKGRLMTSKYIMKWSNGKRNELPCKWNEFSYDNFDNRVLKYVLKYILSKQYLGKGLMKSLIDKLINKENHNFSYFREVSDIDKSELIFSNSKLKNISSYYKKSINLAELIMKNMNRLSGNNYLIKPMSIDMSILFEAFVSGIVKKAFEDVHNAGVVVQEEKYIFKDSSFDCIYFFNEDGDSKGKEKSRADIVVYFDDSPKFVIDVKYKEYYEEDKSHSGFNSSVDKLNIKSSDIYQLYYYMKSRKCNSGIIIYPYWEDNGSYLYPANLTTEKLNEIKGERIIYIGLNLAKDIKDLFNVAVGYLRRFKN